MCILLGVGLDYQRFSSGKCFAIPTYFINKCTSLGISFKTPMEVWNGKSVDYSNFKIFGALDKLDVRVVKCVFIGYPEGVNCYKLWKMDPGGSKLIINNYVTFDETRIG